MSSYTKLQDPIEVVDLEAGSSSVPLQSRATDNTLDEPVSTTIVLFY
jgi:hypothetical protein